MDNKINNVAFGAKFLTKVKGRSNLMSDVAKNFSQKTKTLPGTLEMVRGGSEYPGAMIFRLNEKEGPIFAVTDYADFLGQKQEKITPKFVENVTKQMVGIFKTLTAEVDYSKKIQEVTNELHRVEKHLVANNRLLADLDPQKDKKYIEIFKSLITMTEKRIADLTTKADAIKAEYINKLTKIGKKDPRIAVHAEYEKNFLQ